MSYKGLFDLTGQVAIVTGGSKGMGREIAVGLAAYGADVVGVSRSSDGFPSVIQEVEALGRAFLPVSADMSLAADRDRVVAETLAKFGRIDILVNVAGVLVEGPALELDEAGWDYSMDNNLKALFFLCQAVGKVMLEQGYGRIINLSSTYSFVGRSGRSVYGAGKAAISNLTKTLALEWSGKGVQVNAIAPGPIETPGRAAVFAVPERRAATISKLAIPRLGQSADIVGPTVFLASKAADFITGETLVVDGGFLAQ